MPVQATTGGGGGGAQKSVPEARAWQSPEKVWSSKVTVQASPDAMPAQAATGGGGGGGGGTQAKMPVDAAVHAPVKVRS